MEPPRAKRVWGVVSVARSGPGKVLQFFFGSGGPESVYASQRMGCLKGELQQAVVSWCSLLIARSCMHDIYVSVLGLAEDMEARALKSSPQTKTLGNTPRAKARPTQDGRRSLRRQRGRDGGCGANRFRRKTPRRFH